MRGRATVPTSESAAHATWRRAADVFARRTPRSLVVVTSGAGAPVRIEGAAVLVWEELVHPRSEAELAEAASRRLGVEPGDIVVDVDEALAALVSAGVVVRA